MAGGSDMADRVRLGLIGASVTGTWSARSHLPALQACTDVELTAVCTTKADSAEAARRAWGARLAFDDWRKMMAAPEIDAVAVVVRVPSHYAPTKAALEAGKHVYCEWPLGRTTAEAVELAALAKAKGLVTAVGLQARVNPTVMYMKELVEGGFAGEMMAVPISMIGAPAAPHLAARRRARRQHADDRQRPHDRRDAFRHRRFCAAVGGRGDAGEAMARHRQQHLARRHRARQHPDQRQAGKWRCGVEPCRCDPVR